MKMGLLEFSRTTPGIDPHAAVLKLVASAQRADELGFSRYWLAEHHEVGIAQGSPEVMATLVAAHTERIRVGCAGVLISHACPLRTAKAFRLLQTAYPGRIDVGVAAGRAPPEVAAAFAVAAPASREALRERIEALARCVAGATSFPIHPEPAAAPELWILGSGSAATARLAGELGASFSLSLFASGQPASPSTIDEYRAAFRPSYWGREPCWNIAVAGICADTDAQAQRLGALLPQTSAVRAHTVGSVESWRDSLSSIAAEYQAEEVIFADLCASLEQRVRSCELLATI